LTFAFEKTYHTGQSKSLRQALRKAGWQGVGFIKKGPFRVIIRSLA
jgi:hypothetical protein